MEPLLLPQERLFAGFTGTRAGLARFQYDALLGLLKLLNPREIQHGDCVGADYTVHGIARSLEVRVVMRPPTDDTYRAFCKGAVYTYPPKPYLSRNHDIVNNTSYLIACPKDRKETLRSGTWATVRYAGRTGKVTYLVYPNGQLDRREPVR